jgi:hypothetical protein
MPFPHEPEYLQDSLDQSNREAKTDDGKRKVQESKKDIVIRVPLPFKDKRKHFESPPTISNYWATALSSFSLGYRGR